MVRVFAANSWSIRHYSAFLVLILVTSILSLFIHIYLASIVSEQDILKSVEKITADQLVQEAVFLKKLNIAAKYKDRESSLLGTSSFSFFFDKVSNELYIKNRHKADINSNSTTSRMSTYAEELDTKSNLAELSLKAKSNISVNSHIHIFYYPWYGNPQTDGHYIHWNHNILPHWKKEEVNKWPLGAHIPPHDIGANFYPALGLYSSADKAVVNVHMAQIHSTGTGVVAVSWYPPGQADDNGQPFDGLIPLILDAAQANGVQVCIHIEPYQDRNGKTLNQHIRYLIDTYSDHPGFYKVVKNGKSLPMFYLYDSYQISSMEWAKALKSGDIYSLRGTKYDGIFVGLYRGPEDEAHILSAGFDGFYTYFAANGFTKGSTWSNWKSMAKFATDNNLLFIPSIGPGYSDTRIRPWNGQTTRLRLQGNYFRSSYQAAVDAGAEFISVTSFNEWHEGTQIEPAVVKTFNDFKYEDYSPGGPNFYLQLLRDFVEKFTQK